MENEHDGKDIAEVQEIAAYADKKLDEEAQREWKENLHLIHYLRIGAFTSSLLAGILTHEAFFTLPKQEKFDFEVLFELVLSWMTMIIFEIARKKPEEIVFAEYTKGEDSDHQSDPLFRISRRNWSNIAFIVGFAMVLSYHSIEGKKNIISVMNGYKALENLSLGIEKEPPARGRKDF